MSTNTSSSTPFDLPPNFEYAKDSKGKTYYIDHTNETTSYIHPNLKSELPPNFECRIDSISGKTYFVNHTTGTTSSSHPNHKTLHRSCDTDLDSQYPHEQGLDAEGRHFYKNRETKTTSWLHPLKLAELEASCILDEDLEGAGEAWKAWIVEDVAECGLNKGTSYWVNYRNGVVDWQSPEDKRIARQKALERRAAMEAAKK